MVRRIRRKKRNTGAVLPLVMCMVALLVILGYGFMTLETHSRRWAAHICTDIAARAAADAGLAKATYAMKQKLDIKPWNDDTLPQAIDEALPSSDATFSYAVVKSGPGNYSVQSTGNFGNAQRTVAANLRLERGIVFDYALFAREDLELKNKATVDAINLQAGDDPLKVGTNSTSAAAITLKNKSLINGDVVVGPGGDPDEVIQHNGANITGDTYAMPTEQQMPEVVVPTFLDSAPSQGSIDGSVTISTSGRYESIELGNSDVIVIDEPVVLYVTGKVELGNAAKIVIGGPADADGDASLTLYLGGNLEGKNSSGFNNVTQDAARFQLFGLPGCQDVELKNASDFYGAVYAPDAYMELKNSADVYGSIMTDSFEMKNSATIYFDASLRDVEVDFVPAHFVLGQWEE